MIQVVALDEAIPHFRPNLIKMDVEGAEMDALRGAGRLIQKYRPGLAISSYHHPAHLWQIPKLVSELCPEHKLYLRCHSHSSFDLVLYAFPRST